jgi:serine phosphatase RsbU (regulator of sigma subunit)
MYMAIFRSLFRAYADQQYILHRASVRQADPEESLTGAFRRADLLASGASSLKNAIDLTNHYIATQHGNSNMFATVFFGLLDPEQGSLLYINAGHEPALMISQGRLIQRLDPTGPAVGMLPDMAFGVERAMLAPGDSLILYTDGITDALNPAGEQFADERLLNAATSPAPSAQGRIQNIMSALDMHIAQREQYDDVTLLAVQRNE